LFGIRGDPEDKFNMIIFGDTFLRSYYNIYDFENNRVGLALHKWSSAAIENDSKLWIYVLIIGSILLVILVALYCWKKRRDQKITEERNR